MTLTDSMKKNSIEEKAESIYAYYDDLLARDLTLDGQTTSEDITEFAKDCARRVCSEVIVALDDIKKQFKQNKIFVPDGGIDHKINEWYQIGKMLEGIRD